MLQLDDVAIARVCHAANRALQKILGEDNVSPSWGDAPLDMRASAVEGVAKAMQGATPEQLHQSWCEFKLKDGWTYGTVKDFDAKTHPCLVAYGDLPEEQRIKDRLFLAIVQALTEREIGLLAPETEKNKDFMSGFGEGR